MQFLHIKLSQIDRVTTMVKCREISRLHLMASLDDDASDLDLGDVLLLRDGVEQLAARGQLRDQRHLVARVVHVDQSGDVQGCQILGMESFKNGCAKVKIDKGGCGMSM